MRFTAPGSDQLSERANYQNIWIRYALALQLDPRFAGPIP